MRKKKQECIEKLIVDPGFLYLFLEEIREQRQNKRLQHVSFVPDLAYFPRSTEYVQQYSAWLLNPITENNLLLDLFLMLQAYFIPTNIYNRHNGFAKGILKHYPEGEYSHVMLYKSNCPYLINIFRKYGVEIITWDTLEEKFKEEMFRIYFTEARISMKIGGNHLEKG